MGENNSWTTWLGQPKKSTYSPIKYNYGDTPQSVGKPKTTIGGDSKMWEGLASGIASGLGSYFAGNASAKAAKYAADLQAQQAAAANKLAVDQFNLSKSQIDRANSIQDQSQDAMEQGMLASGYQNPAAKRPPLFPTIDGLAATSAQTSAVPALM